MAHTHDLVLLDGEELDQRLSDSRRELFNLRFQLATGQLDNPARVGLVRREVARILTVLREREILEAEGMYVAPTEEQHEAARARLAAEAAAAEAAAAARASSGEAGGSVDEDDELGEDAEGDDNVDDLAALDDDDMDDDIDADADDDADAEETEEEA